MSTPRSETEVFLAGAEVVVSALGDDAVASCWDRPSVLEDQAVASLCGHLARGGVWVVEDYLAGDPPPGPADFGSAGEYFAELIGAAGDEDHKAIRDRGAAVSAIGHSALVDEVRRRLDDLGPRLRAMSPDHLVTVAYGKVIRLGDYLLTRVVEQVVHLDDLARSVGLEPWTMPTDAVDVAVEVGLDVARRRRGDTAVLRALYRQGFAADALPAF